MACHYQTLWGVSMKKMLLCLFFPVVAHAQDTRIIPDQPPISSRIHAQPKEMQRDQLRGRAEQPPRREFPQHPEGRDTRRELPPRIIQERPIIIERSPNIYDQRYMNRGISIYLDTNRCKFNPNQNYWGPITSEQRMLLVEAQIDFCNRVREILMYP